MAASRAVISVIGSLNVDLVTRTSRMPNAGETLTARSFDVGFGGKGANQAVACARLSRTERQARNREPTPMEVRMVGAIGTDQFSKDFLAGLQSDGLNVSRVLEIGGAKTGTATIIVEEETGENRILVSPGANHLLPTSMLLDTDTTVALFQLEIPIDIVMLNMKAAKERGIEIVFNPAPAVALPDEIYRELGHLIINESEASILSNSTSEVTADSDLNAIASNFIDKGVGTVVITLGAHGAFYQSAARIQQGLPGKLVAAQKVKVVDTTAAGDTFVGAYAVAVARSALQAESFDLEKVIDFANRAAAQTVQKEGAQKSIPWMDQIS